MTHQVLHADRTFQFECHDDFIGTLLSRGAFYEVAMLEHIAGLHAPGLYVDVGACIGTHTVFFSEECPACSGVICFEPAPSSYQLLTKNIEVNCHRVPVTARNLAVGEQAGTGGMVVVPANMGMCRVVPATDGKTRISSLDEELASESVALIKIDVEGFEYEVLRGARRTLQLYHPHLFIEITDAEEMDKIQALLTPFGYRRRRMFNRTPTYHFSIS